MKRDNKYEHVQFGYSPWKACQETTNFLQRKDKGKEPTEYKANS